MSRKLKTSDVISYAIKYVQIEINKCEDILNKDRRSNHYFRDVLFINCVRSDLLQYKADLLVLQGLQADCLKQHC